MAAQQECVCTRLFAGVARSKCVADCGLAVCSAQNCAGGYSLDTNVYPEIIIEALHSVYHVPGTLLSPVLGKVRDRNRTLIP